MSDHGAYRLVVRDFLIDLQPEKLPALLHMLSCGDCRQLAELATSQSADYSALWLSLEVKTPGLSAALEAQRAVAEDLFCELLAQAPPIRLVQAKSERFKHLGLAEKLLAESRRAQPGDLELSRQLARLGLTIARQFALNDRADAVKVQALCLEANALRLKKDKEGADSLFRSAALQITSPPGSWERGIFCRMLADLRRDQGRVDEATALLWQASLIFREEADLQAEGEALGVLGALFLDEDDFARALAPLARAWALVDPRVEPVQAVDIGLRLALCEAETGRGDAARVLLGTAQALANGVEKPPDANVRWPWLAARIALSTEAFDLAGALLAPLRDCFLDCNRLYEAALVSLDLGHAWARTGRAGEVHGLMHDVLAAFPLTAEKAGAFEALGLFLAAVDIGFDDLAGAVRKARALLRRFHHNPVNAAHDLALLAKREQKREGV